MVRGCALLGLAREWTLLLRVSAHTCEGTARRRRGDETSQRQDLGASNQPRAAEHQPDQTEASHVNRPLQVIAQRHDLRTSPPVGILPHERAVVLPREVELRRRRLQEVSRLEAVAPLQERGGQRSALDE